MLPTPPLDPVLAEQEIERQQVEIERELRELERAIERSDQPHFWNQTKGQAA